MKKIKTRKAKIKKNKKKGITILSIIIIITATIHVNAGIENSTIIKKIIDDTYAVIELEGNKKISNLTYYQLDGKTAYCIDLRNKISTNNYNSTTDLTKSELSNEKIEKIKKIMYFGYDYPGHADYKYYMAAQEMIWKTIEDIDIFWSNEINTNGQPIDIESYKNEINKLIKDSNIVPSFTNDTYTTTIGSKIKPFDTNNVLQFYEIKDCNNLTCNISSPFLILETNNNSLGTNTITLTREQVYSIDSYLYYSDSSKKLMTAGKIDMRDPSFKVKVIGLTLNINMVDSETKEPKSQGQASLNGAIYEIYDEENDLITTFSTTEGQQNKIDSLLLQKYTIKQIKASPGYKINNNEIEITLKSQEENITLEEEVIKSKIEILKIYGDKDTNQFQKEKNIKFDIYDNNQKLYKTITTNDIGYADIYMPYGIYTIKQNNTTPGYSKVEDIYLDINENSEEIIRYNLFNKIIKVKINLITKDSESRKNILQSKIKYKLKDKTTNEYISYNNNDFFETNELGEVLIPQKLPYGTYQLEQISAPNNYILNKEKIEFTIDETSNIITNDEGLLLNIYFTNKPIKGKINIETKEEVSIIEENNYYYDTLPRQNVELTIIANSDIIAPDGIKKYTKGDIIETITTNELGQAQTSILYLGNYCIKEKNNKKCITLETKNKTSEIIEENITLTNKLDKYDITLINKEENAQNTLKGTIIELYNDKNLIINTSITNDEGLIKISNLPKGKYYFKQKSINDKYIINNEKVYFEVLDKNIELTIMNKKIQNKEIFNLEIPNTLSNNYYLKEILSISLIIIGIFIYANKKKNNKFNNN